MLQRGQKQQGVMSPQIHSKWAVRDITVAQGLWEPRREGAPPESLQEKVIFRLGFEK